LIQVGVPVAGRNDVSPDHRPGSSTVHSPEIGSYDDNVFPYESGDPEDNAGLSDHGQTVWGKLVDDNDQVFLTVNGHYWPPGRTTKKNAAGNGVHMHIANSRIATSAVAA
jgi:hypothetical protein